MTAQSRLLDLAFGGAVAHEHVAEAPQQEHLAHAVEQPLLVLPFGEGDDHDGAEHDEAHGWSDAHRHPFLAEEIQGDQPQGFQDAEGEEYPQGRLVDGVEHFEGELGVLSEVFVLENERQIEEVEQEERHHVQMASFTADEVRGKGDRSRRDTDEHDEDRVEVEGDLQGLVPLAFPFAGRPFFMWPFYLVGLASRIGVVELL